jgi:hypothetical protein
VVAGIVGFAGNSVVFNDCQNVYTPYSSLTVLAPAPVAVEESLNIGVGSGGAPGAAGGPSVVMRGSTTLVSAGGGAGAAITAGGAGGQVLSAGGIVRTGNAGGSGSFDFMCNMGPGNPPSTPPGKPGGPIQGSVIPLGSGTGGQGERFFSNATPPQPGQAGELILTW